MRVLIMADMEGVSGIAAWDQVKGGAPQYEAGRVLYTEEINAAVRGCKLAGATDVVVVDCHGAGGEWTFNSLLPERIDPDCTWVTRHPWGRPSVKRSMGFLTARAPSASARYVRDRLTAARPERATP